MHKIRTIGEGLDEIEKIDNQVCEHLAVDDYGSILKLLKERLIVISQMHQIKGKEKLPDHLEKRLDIIFNVADKIQTEVIAKRDKIQARLTQSKKINTQHKKLRY
ncbi:MAG: hypothetical protein LW817_07795 [Candidatus Caenarcaniphilales bacterium]|jgi:hypothetical protein|nr:hypothetical protein [Candidatus Caenarcaniphilales bacterium]